MAKTTAPRLRLFGRWEDWDSPHPSVGEYSLLQIRDRPTSIVGRIRLSSDSRSPRARNRFGFSGSPTRQKKERVTTDDILDGLTRQAELRQKLGEDDPVRLDEIAGTEELIQFQGFNPEPALHAMIDKKRSWGHLAFVFMLLTGLTVVWLYGSISKPFDLTSLNGIIQRSGIQSIFANRAQLGIIALAALLGALCIRHRRRGSSLRLLSS